MLNKIEVYCVAGMKFSVGHRARFVSHPGVQEK